MTGTKTKLTGYLDKSDFLLIATLPLLFFFSVPANVMLNNAESLGHLDYNIALLIYISLTIAATIISIASFVLLARFKATSGAIVAARLLFAFLFTTGLLLPLTGSTGQVETSEIPVNWTNLLAASSLSLGLLIALSMRLKTVTTLAMSGMVIANALIAGTQTLSRSTGDTFKRLASVSSSHNIFVVSFDGLGRDVGIEIVQEDPAVAEQLKDFTIFSNIISTAPSTQTSLTSETMGGIDLKSIYGTEERMLTSLDKDRSITSHLERNGYDVAIYGFYSFTFPNAAKTVPPWALSSPVEQIDQASSLFELATARMVSPPLAFGRDIANQVGIRFLDPKLTDPAAMEADLAGRTRHHRGAMWDIPNIAATRDFYAYVDRLQIGADNPTAHFMHFLHTHYPVDFDEQCRYRSDDEVWFKANQDREGFKAESKCAFTQFGLFIRKLKELGIYDRSTIIFKSDHGQPIAYTDPNRMESFDLRGHEVWGYARHTPWLAIKPQRSKQDAARWDDRPAILSDLAKTVCVAKTSGSCDEFEGFDLMGKDAPPKDSRYFVNLISGPESTFKMDTHQSVSLPRHRPLFVELTNLIADEVLVDQFTCGTVRDVSKGTRFNNGLTGKGQWVSWKDADTQFLRWGTPACSPSTATLQIRADVRETNAEVNIAFALDGKRVLDQMLKPTQNGSLLTIQIPLPQVRGGHTLSVLPEKEGVSVRFETLMLN